MSAHASPTGEGAPAAEPGTASPDGPTTSSPLDEVKAQIDRHPYGAVAAAVGVGYVLGGGVFTGLTARIVRLGLRIGARGAVLPLLERELSRMAEAFVAEKSAEDPVERPGPRPTDPS